jgi:hypothetical protein
MCLPVGTTVSVLSCVTFSVTYSVILFCSLYQIQVHTYHKRFWTSRMKTANHNYEYQCHTGTGIQDIQIQDETFSGSQKRKYI